MMPEVTVSLRLHRGQRFIAETVESVLRQMDVDLDLVIVHDGSADHTLQILKPFERPELRHIINPQQMGEAFCRNSVITGSRSPFILQMTSGCILLPGAIKTLTDVIRSSDHVGVVHCSFFDIEDDERLTRDSYHRRTDSLRTRFKAGTDYRAGILFKAQGIGDLRMYRRDVFNCIGTFNERTRSNVDVEFSLRLLETLDIVFLPSVLYYRKTVGKKASSWRRKRFKSWCEVFPIYVKLRKLGRVSSLHTAEYRPAKVVVRSLSELVGFRQIIERMTRVFKRYYRDFVWHAFSPISDAGYTLIRNVLSRWHLLSPGFNQNHVSPSHTQIAYFIWRYPEPSQTFVQREIAALRNSGVSVSVITESHDASNFLEEYRHHLSKNTICLNPIDKTKLRKHRRHFFFKDPCMYIRLFLYVFCRSYHVLKNPPFDRKVFSKSVYLAGILRENGVTHIHSPWADLNAFIALIASRLLGIPYSVHARAHDIHRKTYLYGLSEKFENANFVITNTQYNVNYLSNLLNHAGDTKIHLVYNGLNLERFRPEGHRTGLASPPRILCVARLIEQKGLIYLLKACQILKERGITFRCQIIGGPENPLFMNYYVALRSLHRKLHLEEDVFFLGSQPFSRVVEAYRDADIFVLPCVIAQDGSRDITPNSLIEAMAMELPVISTDITGIPEIVDDGVNGILVPPHDENVLSEAILRLIKDESVRRELGACARRKVESRFDINKNIIHYVTLFQQRIYKPPVPHGLED